MTVKLVTDSTSYISNDIQKELDITVIPLSVHFPDESFNETEVDFDYFYKKINSTGIIPTSSQPAIGQIYSIFEEIVCRNDEVLAIFLSSEMSGTYESALTVKDMILEKYPTAAIEILDSRTNCMSLGFSVIEAAKCAREGKSLAEIVKIASKVIKGMHFYFVPTTLEYLRKGGRIGGAAALIGSLFNIKPILYVNNGKTDLLERVRGTRATINRMLNLLENDYKEHGLKAVIVHHINAPEKARELVQRIINRYGFDVPLVSIGPVIGCHVGPGAIGIVYCTED